MSENLPRPVKLKAGSHVHMMGVCGTAMGGLAGLLKNLGYKVTGSDQNVYPPMSIQLRELGIQIMEGYKKQNLATRPDFVIVGNVMTRKHEEVQALLASDIPYASLPEAIGELVIGARKSIVVTGTHGKTTTTALMSWVAETCGKDPGFLIGGKPVNFDISFRLPKQDFFVIEGDEYDTAFFAKIAKFVYYKPRHVILTSVEFDHADIYKDLDDVVKAFARLAEMTPSEGSFIYHAEDVNIPKILGLCKAREKWGYGFNKGDFQIRFIEFTPTFCEFDIYFKGAKEAHVRLPIFGRHNALNAVGVYATAKVLGWSNPEVLQGFETFKGVRRRQEIIGQPREITVIEDFAHHPTAVKVTLESIRDRFKDRKVFSVFEPRSATTRRKVFQQDYVDAFTGPGTVLLARPFNQASISEADRFSSEDLVHDLQKVGCDAHLMDSADSIVEYLKAQSRPGNVIVIMSNGAFDGIYGKLLNALK